MNKYVSNSDTSIYINIPNTNIDSIRQSYSKLKSKFGSFWSLYLIGIGKIANLKYSLLSIIIMLIINFMTSYSINRVVMNIDNQIQQQIKWIFFITCILWSKSIIDLGFEKKLNIERVQVSQRLFNFVNNLYLNASINWKNQNPNLSQKDSLQQIFFSYGNISYTLEFAITNLLNTISIFGITCSEGYTLGFIIILGNIFLIKIRYFLNKESSEINKKISDTLTNINIITSNQFTNRADSIYNKSFGIFKLNDDPSDGLTKNYDIWNNRDYLSKKTNNIINIISNTLILLICFYLYMINNSKLIIFCIINKHQIFGLMNVISNFTQIREISDSRLAITFKMLDDIILELDTLDKLETNTKPQLYPMTKFNNFTNITIHSINRIISDNIRLIYDGKIIINNISGIILLDGEKGCGKSVTMDILAGMYDKIVTNGVFVDNNELNNEFRDLSNDRVYIRQCVGDDYRQNKKNTITMNLSELFPNTQYDEIFDFIKIFGISNKIPSDVNTSISNNERGLSPGQLQSIILASQLWRAIKLKTPLLLLDEPERNIDFETIKLIFGMLVKSYNGTIIMITHLNELKLYLEELKVIKQKWIYQSNTNILTFTIKNY
jgi:ABC-type multidrug transport system ATPase subunit